MWREWRKNSDVWVCDRIKIIGLIIVCYKRCAQKGIGEGGHGCKNRDVPPMIDCTV